MVNGAIYPLTYDLLNDFEPISLIASNPQLLVAKKSIPAKDLKELIAWVKANQDKVSAGTAGAGAASHVSGVYFQSVTGTKFTFVPYRGTGPALQDVVAGNLDLMFDQAASALPQVRNGNVRAFAVTSKTRLTSAPDIPTVDEAGDAGILHRGLARAVAAQGHAEGHRDAAERGGARDARRPGGAPAPGRAGQDIPPRDQQTPEALYAYHKAEIEKWWPIIKAAGIKPGSRWTSGGTDEGEHLLRSPRVAVRDARRRAGRRPIRRSRSPSSCRSRPAGRPTCWRASSASGCAPRSASRSSSRTSPAPAAASASPARCARRPTATRLSFGHLDHQHVAARSIHCRST